MSDIRKLAHIPDEVTVKRFKRYIDAAGEELTSTFGYELCCLRRFQKPNCYLISNKLCDNLLEHVNNKMVAEFYQLLYCVLAMITMSATSINEVTLTNQLRSLVNQPEHFQFYCHGENSVNHFLKEANKQMYLRKIVELNDDTRTVCYEWGCRAVLEIKRLDVLQFVSKVYSVDVKLWGELYKKCIQLDLDESNQRLTTEDH